MMWKQFSMFISLYLLSLPSLETTNAVGTLLDRKLRLMSITNIKENNTIRHNRSKGGFL